MPQLSLYDEWLLPIPGKLPNQSGAATCITMSQFRQWLASVDLAMPGRRFCDQIPADPYNPLAAAWNGPFVSYGDVLCGAAQSYLGFTTDMMTAAFIQAGRLALTPSP